MKEQYSEGNTQNDLNKINRSMKRNKNKTALSEAPYAMAENMKHIIEEITDTGASAWLNALPFKNKNFDLNKEEFRDALRLRGYDIPLENLPSNNSTRTIQYHVTHRHNRIPFTALLGKVCIYVENEPHLLLVTTEKFQYRTSNIEDRSRLDMKTSDFWRRRQRAFFDVRTTHVNSQSNKDKTKSKTFSQ